MVVLLHGMGTGASAWLPQLEAFGERHLALAPYLPGYGDNPGPFSIEAARDQVVAFVLETTETPVHVCGLSLGALVALEIARAHPRLIRSLSLSAGFVSLPDEYLAPRRASAEVMRSYDPEALRREVLPSLVNDVPEPHKERALEEISTLTPADMAYLLELDFDARSWIEQVEVPALVLCGENDAVNLPLSRVLATSLPDAEFQVLPDAGHVANLDAPEAFNVAHETFWAKLA